MMDEVLSYLKAIAGMIGKHDAKTVERFYMHADANLSDKDARKALNYGSLAMVADAYKMPIRRAYYGLLFRRAIRKLKKAEA
jgi:hypothetical protein